jgi:hypothetical protein
MEAPLAARLLPYPSMVQCNICHAASHPTDQDLYAYILSRLNRSPPRRTRCAAANRGAARANSPPRETF